MAILTSSKMPNLIYISKVWLRALSSFMSNLFHAYNNNTVSLFSLIKLPPWIMYGMVYNALSPSVVSSYFTISWCINSVFKTTYKVLYLCAKVPWLIHPLYLSLMVRRYWISSFPLKWWLDKKQCHNRVASILMLINGWQNTCKFS